jgi:hypothetical protein
MSRYDLLFSLPFLFMVFFVFLGMVGVFFNIFEIMIVSIAFLLVFLVYLFIDLIFYDRGTLLQKSLLILSFVFLLANLFMFTEFSIIFYVNIVCLCYVMTCMSESLVDPDYHQLINSSPKSHLVLNIFGLIDMLLLILNQKINLPTLVSLVSLLLISFFVFSTIFYSFKGIKNMDESKS